MARKIVVRPVGKDVINRATGNGSLLSRGLNDTPDAGTLNYSHLNEILYKGRDDRLDRYRIYDAMDEDLDISRALDMIAEYCTSEDSKTKLPFMFDFPAENVSVYDTDVLHDSLQHWGRLNDWDERSFKMVRNVIKYGDAFYVRDPDDFKLYAVPASNVIGVYIDPETNEPCGYHMRDLLFKFDFMNFNVPKAPDTNASTAYQHYNNKNPTVGTGEEAIVPAEHVLHISMAEGRESGGDGENAEIWPFGQSFLEPIFKTYKQRDLLENAALIHRIQRAPSRRVWYVDVGKMRPDKARAFMNKFKNELIQKRIPTTFGGADRMDAVYDPISMMEDIYLPQMADGRGSKVDNLEGTPWNSLDDLKYFTGKIMRGLKVPSSFMLGPEEGGATFQDGRAGVAYVEEKFFAQFCQRIQKRIRSDLDFEFKMFLKFKGIQIHSSEFRLSFTPPINFEEYREGDLNTERLNRMAQAFGVGHFSKRWVMQTYGGLTLDDIQENERMWMEENAPTTAAEYGQDTGMGGFAGPGSLGGFDFGGGDMGGPEAGMNDEFGAEGGGDIAMPPGLGGAGSAAPAGGAGGGVGGGVTPAGIESRIVKSTREILREAMYGGWTPELKQALREASSPKDSSGEAYEKHRDDSPEPIPGDGSMASVTDNADDKMERPRLTLAHVRKMRLEKEENRRALHKRLQLMKRMYSAPPEPGGF